MDGVKGDDLDTPRAGYEDVGSTTGSLHVLQERASISSGGARGATTPGSSTGAQAWKGSLRLGTALKHQLWVQILFVIVFVGIPTLIVDMMATPRSRFFLTGDPTLSYPGPGTSTVPFWFVGPVFIIIVAIVAVVELTMFKHSHTSPTMAAWTIIYFALDLAVCMAANMGITNNLKYIVGRLRPDFFNRCDLPANTALDTAMYNAAACTSDNEAELHDGMMSFPSGHTSFAFCQGMYLAVYLLWSFYVRTRSAPTRTRSRIVFELLESVQGFAIFIGPLFAWFVGVTRITDYKHHPSDVNAGAIIGTVCAVLVFVRGVGLYSRVKPEVAVKAGDVAPDSESQTIV